MPLPPSSHCGSWTAMVLPATVMSLRPAQPSQPLFSQHTVRRRAPSDPADPSETRPPTGPHGHLLRPLPSHHSLTALLESYLVERPGTTLGKSERLRRDLTATALSTCSSALYHTSLQHRIISPPSPFPSPDPGPISSQIDDMIRSPIEAAFASPPSRSRALTAIDLAEAQRTAPPTPLQPHIRPPADTFAAQSGEHRAWGRAMGLSWPGPALD